MRRSGSDLGATDGQEEAQDQAAPEAEADRVLMPPIDDFMMLDDPAAAMPVARDFLSLEEPEALAPEMEPQEEHPVEKLYRWADIQRTPNIATELDESVLNAIGQKVLREYDIDLQSRSDWEDKSRKAMDLAMQVAEKKTFPWPNASNVVYPAMTLAAVQFNARAYPSIIQGSNVVKGKVVGKDDGVPMPPEMMQRMAMGGGQGGGMPMIPMGGGAPPMMPGMGMGGGPQEQPGMGHNGGPAMEPPQQQWMIPPGAKAERAKRVADHMSWQLLEEMTEWVQETDKLLLILPIIGCAFRKSFFDHSVGHNASLLVLAQNLVINHNAKSMERAPRITEQIQFYPHEVAEQVRAGLWLDQEYGTASNANGDDDAPLDFLEQHRYLDLDEDGYAEPYIVTVHKDTSKVARIVARYDAEGIKTSQDGQIVKIDPVHYYTKYDFIPNPDGGIYGVGFGQLLTPINEATNTTLNQLFDAGSLANTGGGFIGRGVSMHAGSLKFRLGEWKQINTPGSALKDAIVPFNHPGPSPVLFQLLALLIEAGKEVSGNKDVLTGDVAAATMQPTTLLSLIQQGLKGFIAVFNRVYASLEEEFSKLYRLNRIYLQQQAQYNVGDEWRTVTKEDYERTSGVKPVADPNRVSDMQRMAEAQLLMSFMNDPNCNRVEILKRIFASAQVEDPEKLIVEEMPPNPAILAQTAELEAQNREIDIKEQTARVTQIKDYTQALLNVAKAEEADAASNLEYSAQWLKAIEIGLNSLLKPAEGRGQQGQPQMPMPQLPMEPSLDGYQFGGQMMQ